MSQFYQELCNMVIRPTRQKYQPYDLGNPIYNSISRRKDFQVLTHHHLKLKCSFYQNLNNQTAPCVIYLHSFNGSRLQSIRYSSFLAESGLNMCSFDFAGCGNSEGEYVSLGYHQKYDLMEVIKYIGRNYQIWNFILWGRSMGASCIISYLEYLHNLRRINYNEVKHINIISCVLDSPFCSLSRLAIQIAQKKISIPEILLKAVFLVIKSTVEAKADFKVDQLQLTKYVHHIQCPVLLLTSQQDTLVKSWHSQQIYNALKCSQKQLVFIKGEHHQMRDTDTINRVIKFIIKYYRSKEDKNKKSVSKTKFQQLQTSKSLHKSIIYQQTPTQNHTHLVKQISQHYRNDSAYYSPNSGFKIIYRTTPKVHQHGILLDQKRSIIETPKANNIYLNKFGPDLKVQTFQMQQNQMNQIHTDQKNQYIVQNTKIQQVVVKLFKNQTDKTTQSQHFNVINNKLKKRKKQTLNYPNHQQTFDKTYKVSNIPQNLQKNPNFSNNPQVQYPNNNIKTFAFIPQQRPSKIQYPNSPKKTSQRFNTMVHCQGIESTGLDLTKRCKNAFSMKNFGNSVRLFREPKQILESESLKDLASKVKHKNKNELKTSKKCINLKSPKRVQQVEKNH